MPERIAAPQSVKIGGAQIHLQNVLLREDVLVDEVHLDGENITLDPPADEKAARVNGGETKFRAILSEPNVNRMLENNIPEDAPVRHLKIAFLSGKARISGNYIKMMSLPFTVEAILTIQNGTRVFLDFQSVSAGGMFTLPHAVVESLEKLINEKLDFDLSQSPIPVWLDTLVCEPGRLTATGRARIVWPPPPIPSALPFSPLPTIVSAATTPGIAGGQESVPEITD